MTSQSIPRSWQPPAGPGHASRRPVRFVVEDFAMAAAGVIVLLGGLAWDTVAGGITDSRREALLQQRGIDAAAVITDVWRSGFTDRHMVAYRFTAEHRGWSGVASAPEWIWTSLRRGAPLAIRYVPGRPRLNQPVEWASPRSFGWLPRLQRLSERKLVLLQLDPATHEALQRWAGADLRSLNAQIEFLLRRALINDGRLKPLEEAPPVESEP